MTTITLQGNPMQTVGALPEPGQQAPDFVLTASDLADKTLADYRGRRLVLNIFPSVDTGTCAASVRAFNQKASELDNTTVLNVSMDLPFAQARFCGAEGLDNVEAGSAFRSAFGEEYGVTIKNGPMTGLLSRAVVVIDANGKVLHSQQVEELANEPDYDAALAVL